MYYVQDRLSGPWNLNSVQVQLRINCGQNNHGSLFHACFVCMIQKYCCGSTRIFLLLVAVSEIIFICGKTEQVNSLDLHCWSIVSPDYTK